MLSSGRPRVHAKLSFHTLAGFNPPPATDPDWNQPVLSDSTLSFSHLSSGLCLNFLALSFFSFSRPLRNSCLSGKGSPGSQDNVNLAAKFLPSLDGQRTFQIVHSRSAAFTLSSQRNLRPQEELHLSVLFQPQQTHSRSIPSKNTDPHPRKEEVKKCVEGKERPGQQNHNRLN